MGAMGIFSKEHVAKHKGWLEGPRMENVEQKFLEDNVSKELKMFHLEKHKGWL